MMTVASTWSWDAYINNRLYNCTDGGAFDFLAPGDWVHNPVSVNRITRAHSMSDPDTIKAGWSIQRLWIVWFSFVASSVAMSLFLATLWWRRGLENVKTTVA